MRGFPLLLGVSFAGATSLHAGPVEIGFSENLSVIEDGIFVPDIWAMGEEAALVPSEMSAVTRAEAVGGAAASSEAVDVKDLEPTDVDMKDMEPPGVDMKDMEPLAPMEVLAVDMPDDITLSPISTLVTKGLVGTYDMTEAIEEALDIPELPEGFEGGWAACETPCFLPGLDMFEVWQELSSADPEQILTDLDAEPLEEQQPAHTSLPATAILLGGAVAALALRRRRMARV